MVVMMEIQQSCEVHCVRLEGSPKRVKKLLFLEYPEDGFTYFLIIVAKYPTYPSTRRHSQGGTLTTDVVRRTASGSTPWHARQVLVVRLTTSEWRHNAYINEYSRMLEFTPEVSLIILTSSSTGLFFADPCQIRTDLNSDLGLFSYSTFCVSNNLAFLIFTLIEIIDQMISKAPRSHWG